MTAEWENNCFSTTSEPSGVYKPSPAKGAWRNKVLSVSETSQQLELPSCVVLKGFTQIVPFLTKARKLNGFSPDLLQTPLMNG